MPIGGRERHYHPNPGCFKASCPGDQHCPSTMGPLDTCEWNDRRGEWECIHRLASDARPRRSSGSTRRSRAKRRPARSPSTKRSRRGRG